MLVDFCGTKPSFVDDKLSVFVLGYGNAKEQRQSPQTCSKRHNMRNQIFDFQGILCQKDFSGRLWSYSSLKGLQYLKNLVDISKKGLLL